MMHQPIEHGRCQHGISRQPAPDPSCRFDVGAIEPRSYRLATTRKQVRFLAQKRKVADLVDNQLSL
jgi:hypothetical protein